MLKQLKDNWDKQSQTLSQAWGRSPENVSGMGRGVVGGGRGKDRVEWVNLFFIKFL